MDIKRPAARTPMAFVRAILEAYRRAGLPADKALAYAQIAATSVATPFAFITAEQMERISYAAMQELDDEALGWFTRRLPWGSYGMLARASISSANLGVALKRWCRHHNLLTSDISFSIRTSADSVCISIEEHQSLGDLQEFCAVSLLRNIHGLACWLIDSRIPLFCASFPYPPPEHHRSYEVLFPCQRAFSAASATITFDAGYLEQPLRRDEQSLNKMLQHALPLTVRQYKRDRLLVQRVKTLLATRPQLTHNARHLAVELGLSERTLHRQLALEGARLQQVKDEVRVQRAQEELLRSQRPIKQVAFNVGFSNEKSFSRAFKKQTGLSPGEFRKQAA